MVTFKLNGKTVQGEEGEYILQVAEKYGVEIPTLCHHKALEPAAYDADRPQDNLRGDPGNR